MLVVISIIGVLVAMLLPAVHGARAASQQVACAAHLRQFGMTMQKYAGRNHGQYCSGAFDWKEDGCVTEVGWVADMVDSKLPAGQMLCPSNPHRIAATYNDLFTLDPLSQCLDRQGSPPQLLPDGSEQMNPCRRIAVESLAPGSEARRQLIERDVYDQSYNTNYTASWFLVRTGVRLDGDGNLSTKKPGCGKSLASRNSTIGPLRQSRAHASSAPLQFIPLLGDGQAAGVLAQDIGPVSAGSMVVRSFTAGPVVNPTMQVPMFPPGTPFTGAGGTWAAWTYRTRQDYRGFAPLHRGGCNILFADGSVRLQVDTNGDGLLNNGFTPTPDNGYQSDEVDLVDTEVFSGWSLNMTR
jgi:prepilin-type processing-associated H-X9-DG protein